MVVILGSPYSWSLSCLIKNKGSQNKPGSRRFQTELARRFREDLVLDGKRPNTVKVYLNAIAHLAEHFGTSPAKLSEAQVRSYVLQRRSELALNSMRPVVGALKFFYRITVCRDWPTLQAIRLPKSRTVPVVLVPEKCWQLIQATEKLYLNVFLRTAYTCGLRIGDVRQLRPQDVDRDRMLLRICTTKGNHQREIPLPIDTLVALRTYWSEHRNGGWLFPSRASLDNIGQANGPISKRSVQRGFQQVVQSLGWKQPGLCVHTLRHSYATAMLEAGVNLKVLQTYLGHQNIEATEIYLHLTPRSNEAAQQIVQSIMNGPSADRSTDDSPSARSERS